MARVSRHTSKNGAADHACGCGSCCHGNLSPALLVSLPMKLPLLLLATFAASASAAPTTLNLWPGTPPGDENTHLPGEVNVTTPADRRPGGREVVRISNVSTPTISVHAPPAEKANGAAVLVCPGGAYVRLAVDLEGSEVCDWLNSIGVTGILLKYRVPRREGVPQWQLPVTDAQRAMRLIRAHAKEWGIDPQRIGIVGFSAGAHVAGVLGTKQDEKLYAPIDAADALSCRPDFTMLIYPGYFTGPATGTIAPEVVVTKDKTPPTFIAMAEDDPVHVENALWYFEALKQAGVPAEMHLYPTGGHGFGLRRTKDAVTTWPHRAAEWMQTSGWLK